MKLSDQIDIFGELTLELAKNDPMTSLAILGKLVFRDPSQPPHGQIFSLTEPAIQSDRAKNVDPVWERKMYHSFLCYLIT